MGSTFLPPEDLPPVSITALDEKLRRQLEKSVAKHFYEACDGVVQGLLCQCNWHITTQATALTLVITSATAAAHWRVLHNLVLLANQLARFGSHAKIRVCPPPELGDPFELWIDELAIS